MQRINARYVALHTFHLCCDYSTFILVMICYLHPNSIKLWCPILTRFLIIKFDFFILSQSNDYITCCSSVFHYQNRIPPSTDFFITLRFMLALSSLAIATGASLTAAACLMVRPLNGTTINKKKIDPKI